MNIYLYIYNYYRCIHYMNTTYTQAVYFRLVIGLCKWHLRGFFYFTFSASSSMPANPQVGSTPKSHGKIWKNSEKLIIVEIHPGHFVVQCRLQFLTHSQDGTQKMIQDAETFVYSTCLELTRFETTSQVEDITHHQMKSWFHLCDSLGTINSSSRHE